MGNRAVITTSRAIDPQNSTDIGVYLHWNGGRDSVEAFLKYCELKQYRTPETDSYGWARLCQVISNYFGGSLSIGIDQCCKLDCDNGDNGTYIIRNWEIVGRKYEPSYEQDSYDITSMLLEIDKAQPVSEQLGKEFLTAKEINTEDVKIGDMVFVPQYDGKWKKMEVLGFGTKVMNGFGLENVPYVGFYGDEQRGYDWNINNYIRTKTVKVAEQQYKINKGGN